MFNSTRAVNRRPKASAVTLFALALLPGFAAAQTPAPKAAPSPDDTPVVKVGATIFSDFTHTSSPSIKDADGDAVKGSAFDSGNGTLDGSTVAQKFWDLHTSRTEISVKA